MYLLVSIKPDIDDTKRIKEEYLRKRGCFLFWNSLSDKRLKLYYFNKGLVALSFAGIGNKSTCPGLGSGIIDGK